MKSTKRTPKKEMRTRGALSAAKLAEMIEEATVDAYGECEQATGWFTVIGDNLEMPFETEVLGVTVTVKRLELRDDNSIVVVCVRGTDRQTIGLVDLPLPSPRPEGAEWIEAYRYWLAGAMKAPRPSTRLVETEAKMRTAGRVGSALVSSGHTRFETRICTLVSADAIQVVRIEGRTGDSPSRRPLFLGTSQRGRRGFEPSTSTLASGANGVFGSDGP